MIAVEAEDRKDRKSPLVRLASAIEPEWLLDIFPTACAKRPRSDGTALANAGEAVTSLLFDQIPIESRRTKERSR